VICGFQADPVGSVSDKHKSTVGHAKVCGRFWPTVPGGRWIWVGWICRAGLTYL